MGYIKKLKIQGFKKFREFEIEFNEKKNIIVGSNEAGKSTILEAIDIILNQKGLTSEKSFIWDMLNIDSIKEFEENPSLDNLPKIVMELDIVLSKEENGRIDFFGETNIEKTEKFGILFKCEFDKDAYGDLLESQINKKEIPVEYYQLSWTTYQGKSYKKYNKPFNSIIINTDRLDTNSSFNYYNKTIFRNKNSISKIMEAKNNFNNNVYDSYSNLKLPTIDKGRSFGINKKKVNLEALISIFDKEVLLENKGCGMENIIKTSIALEKGKSDNDVVLIEEPENHLSHENLLKMISMIETNESSSQVIITTHNDLITSKLGLKNVIWISESHSMSLNILEDSTAKFFVKMDSNNLLYFLLSDKVILVEGPTEGLLIPTIYEEIKGHKIDSDKISIISCGGVSYKRYLEIAVKLGKKVAVVTDNDEKQENLLFMRNYNSGICENPLIKPTNKQHVFMDEDIKQWTWEVCFYHLNEKYFNELIRIDDKSEYCFKNKSYRELGEPVLGRMLNNKVEIAYQMVELGIGEVVIPDYIKDAIEWINK